jgi:hypothetical protein
LALPHSRLPTANSFLLSTRSTSTKSVSRIVA